MRKTLALLFALIAGPVLADSQQTPAPLDSSAQLLKSSNYLLYNQLPPLATAYLGNVITGTAIPTSNSNANAQEQTRTPVYTRDVLNTGVVVGVPCFYATAASTNEEVTNTTGVHKVSLEDGAGNITRLTFNSATTGACSNAVNGVLVSDPVTMTAPIPAGQLMWFKDLYIDATNGILLRPNGVNLANGGGLQFGSALTDLSGTAGPITSTGTVTNSSGNEMPVLFIATQTKVRSFCLYGTSRVFGTFDYFDGANADAGSLARSIGQYAAYINIGLGSDRADWFLASDAARLSLDTYCSDDLVEYTINDITGGRTAVQIEGNLTTINGLLNPAHKISMPTTEPVSTMTAVSISSLTANGNGLVATVVSTAQMFTGEIVTIAGATPTTDNGNCVITAITSTTIFACLNANATGILPATGTITYTDGFGTFINQTTNANNSVLTTVNTWKRGKPTGWYAIPELADVVSAGRNSGTWSTLPCQPSHVQAATPSLNSSWAYDGTHESHCGYMAIPVSGVLSARSLY